MTRSKVIEAIRRLHQAPYLGVDVETPEIKNPQSFEAKAKQLYDVGAGSPELNLAVSSTWYEASGDEREAWANLLRSPIPKVLQNGSFDDMVFWCNDLKLEAYQHDTMVLHRFVAPRQDHDLGYLAAMYTLGPRHKDEFRAGRKDPFSTACAIDRGIYNARDAFQQANILKPMLEQLTHVHRGQELYDLAMDCWRVGIKMRKWGVKIRTSELEELQGPLGKKWKAAYDRAKVLAAEAGWAAFEPVNNHHPRVLFEQHLQAKTRYRTANGAPSYDAKALEQLTSHEEIRVARMARAILDERKLRRLFQYVKDPPIWTDGCVRGDWRPMHAHTLRWSCKGIPLQTIPARSALGRQIRKMFGPTVEGNWVALADFCLAPNTRVLTADLHWKPISKLVVGEELVGFDEARVPTSGGGMNQRYFRRSRVVATSRLTRPCYRITTSKTTVIASAEHRWLTNKRSKSGRLYSVQEWRSTDSLKPGDRIGFYTMPWDEDRSWEAGWLAGFFDGEGWVSTQGVGFGQNDGVALQQACSLLKARGFDFNLSDSEKYKCRKARIKPSREGLRFLGSVRPSRLLEKAPMIWEGAWTRSPDAATVVDVEYIGEQEVIALETTTKTFVAEGLLSHNSQQEMRLCALYSGEPALLEAYAKGINVYSVVGAVLFNEPTSAITKSKAYLKYTFAKIFALAAIYGAEAETIWRQLVATPEFARVSLLQVTKAHGAFFRAFPKVRLLLERLKQQVFKQDYVEECVGGWRYTFFGKPDLTVAYNFPNQAGGARLMNQAVVSVDKELNWTTEGILLQVHDELVLEGPDPLRLIELLQHMTQTVTFEDRTMHFPIEIALGKTSWGECVGIDEEGWPSSKDWFRVWCE